ncbi:unnamed protein product [Parnassius apollo]|uniref:(apollo) hypothetical protein n=1 Tax=Parnassius apollo TaxID=110799 RepID=A0A8S3W3Y3_PARAO|nr:unnamed protein product [Parnassius apollo]
MIYSACDAFAFQRTQEGEGGDKNITDTVARVPPHCHITIKCTREIAGFNGLSEAVRRLDFSSAVRDVRRFNYICALLELLLGGQRLTHLPGAAQKLLLSMLEQLADHVATSKHNPNALRALVGGLAALREAERRACWGRPLGSRALWRHHDRAIARITRTAQAVRMQEVRTAAPSCHRTYGAAPSGQAPPRLRHRVHRAGRAHARGTHRYHQLPPHVRGGPLGSGATTIASSRAPRRPCACTRYTPLPPDAIARAGRAARLWRHHDRAITRTAQAVRIHEVCSAATSCHRTCGAARSAPAPPRPRHHAHRAGRAHARGTHRCHQLL